MKPHSNTAPEKLEGRAPVSRPPALAATAVLCIAALSACGCVVIRADSSDLQLHGKVASRVSQVANLIGLPLNIVCSPLTSVLADRCAASVEGEGKIRCPDWFFAPGRAVVHGTYYVSAAAAYPVQALFESLPRRLRTSLKHGESAVSFLINQMPYLSEQEYAKLHLASGREFAAAYRAEDNLQESYLPAVQSQRVVVRDAQRNITVVVLWGLSMSAECPNFGRKPKLSSALVREWQAWDKSGRPSGGKEEARFVLTHWIMDGFLDPASDGETSVIEDILGAAERDVWLYYVEHDGARTNASMWKFWILEHGGVDGIQNERFSSMSVSTTPRARQDNTLLFCRERAEQWRRKSGLV